MFINSARHFTMTQCNNNKQWLLWKKERKKAATDLKEISINWSLKLDMDISTIYFKPHKFSFDIVKMLFRKSNIKN